MRKTVSGFTLVELCLALLISSVLLLAWVSSMVSIWAQADRQQRIAAQAQLGYQFGLWLARDLDRASQAGLFNWQFDNNCLLYGDDGVRLRNGVMQWRPQSRGCHQPGWIALHDPGGFRVNSFTIQLNGTQQALLTLSTGYQDEQWEWSYQLHGPVRSL